MSDSPRTDRDAEPNPRDEREPRQGPPPSIDEAFAQISDAGREGLSAALDTGRALRGLLIADLALARSALGRALLWVSVAIVFGASSWLLLMAALIALLQGALGWSWLASMSAAAGLSLIVTALGVWQALRYFEHTRLSATRRQLRRLGLGHEDDDDDDREISQHKAGTR
ncbi:MAG: phage holin family protein [Lysobacter sp.]